MVCLKLFQLPCDTSEEKKIMRSLDENVIYNMDCYFGVKIDKCSLFNLVNSIKGFKLRNIILNGSTLNKIQDIFKDSGYNVDVYYDEYKDINRLLISNNDEKIEISANGLISMSNYKCTVVDEIVSIISGDD